MRDYWATFGESPTFSVMLTGYWRFNVSWVLLNIESCRLSSFVMENDYLFSYHVSYRLFRWGRWSSNAALWGFVRSCLFLIVYEIWIGEAAKLAKAAGGNTLAAHKILCWFVLVGWAYLSIRIHVRNWWMVHFLGKALMQFTTSLMLSTKLGLD
jgi:hypothetical protein